MRELILPTRKQALVKLATLAALAMATVAVAALALAGNTKPTGAGKAALYNAPSNFTCPAGAMPAPTDPTFGFAVLNTNSNGDLIANVSVKGGTPNEDYALWVNQDPGGCPQPGPTGSLHTNGQGNGTGQVVNPRVSGATMFWVSAVGGGQVLRSTAVTLD